MDVYLDDFLFRPGPRRKIGYKNPRTLVKLDIPGAGPSYQDMGEDGAVIDWSGVLIEDAYTGAMQLEVMKNTGNPVQLRVTDCPELSSKVRISKFDWELVRKDYVSYSIELAVESAEPGPEPVVVATPSLERSVAEEKNSVKTYTVVSGDTLWAIAGEKLGNPLRWKDIAGLNGIADERKLRVGTVLKLPSP